MSKKSLQKFINDSQKNKKLKNISEESRKKFASKEERFSYVAEEAKKFGYSFTVDDMLDAMEENLVHGFSDDELANVSGGTGDNQGDSKGDSQGGFLSSPNDKKITTFKAFMQDIIGKTQ